MKAIITPVTEVYKGYEIRTGPNGTHSCSLIYKDGQPIGGTFSSPTEKLSSIEKAKAKIDK